MSGAINAVIASLKKGSAAVAVLAWTNLNSSLTAAINLSPPGVDAINNWAWDQSTAGGLSGTGGYLKKTPVGVPGAITVVLGGSATVVGGGGNGLTGDFTGGINSLASDTVQPAGSGVSDQVSATSCFFYSCSATPGVSGWLDYVVPITAGVLYAGDVLYRSFGGAVSVQLFLDNGDATSTAQFAGTTDSNSRKSSFSVKAVSGNTNLRVRIFQPNTAGSAQFGNCLLTLRS